MKSRIIVLLACGILIAAWIVHTNQQRIKQIEAIAKVESLDSERARAKYLLLSECTNALPGIQRVIEVSIDNSADRVSAWRGRATLDFVNHAGGIDRTNLHFVFGTPYGDMLCTLDAQWIANTESNRLEQTFEAAKK
jgi:hypothetical protein